MRPFSSTLILGCVLAFSAVSDDRKPMQPPVAAIKPHKLVKHAHTRTDNYYWLRERDNPEVLSYLKAENAYLDQSLAAIKPLREKLVGEFKSRIKQTDQSVPYRKRGYFYYTRTESGKNYQVFCRKKQSLDAPEEVLVDGNRMAEGHSYFSVGSVETSPDDRLLAYSIDTVGRRFYDVRFRDLSNGKEFPDVIRGVTGSLEWANDNRTVYYTRQDPQTLRSYRLYRHVLGTDAAEDAMVYEEADDTFSLRLSKAKSEKYIFLLSDQTLTTEVRFLDADDPRGEFRVIEPRRRGHEYSAEHFGDSFYIRTNDRAKDFRLVKTPVNATRMENWREVIPHRQGIHLRDVEIFKDSLVAVQTQNGLVQMEVRPWSGGEAHFIEFGEPAYQVFPVSNLEFDTDVIRYRYSSLTTPDSTYDYNMKTRVKTLLKRQEVLAGFDPDNYKVERIYAPAHDGARVPVSVVYRKDMKQKGPQPLLQYGYGSYGFSSEAGFNPFIISLLDRGFVYAIAHIRGGQELGRQWYEDGKLLKKKNTFRDFISATEHLVREKYADARRVYAYGGSAGGLLMGAVMNMRPDLYHGIIAAVPFVDVVTTMLDDSIPLTTGEYDEWGNPGDQTYYEYMLSYSPYDQVESKPYPNLLVTTGLHDSQVQYFEPAKWVAKLRALKKGSSRIVMYTNMDAGHGGASARYKRYEEIALQYAFLLDLAGVKN